MHQPIAPNIRKNPFARVRKQIWQDFKLKWWMWSGQIDKSLNYWQQHWRTASVEQRPLIASALVTHQLYDEALECLFTIPRDRYNAEIVALIAQCYYGKGQLEQALNVIDQALDESMDSRLLELHADCLLELGNWKDAVNSLEKALRISPNRSQTLYRLGTVYLYYGELLEALRCFQGCCNVDSTNPHYWEMKAETHLELGQLKEAVASFKKALRYGVEPGIHARIAYCYVKLDDIKRGIKHYQKALKYEPDNYDVLCNLAAVYQHVGKPLKALNLLERAYGLNANDPILLNNYAYTLVHLGRTRKASEYYKRALELAPNHPIILYNLSVCYAEKGHWEEAIKTLNTLLEAEPNHTGGWILLGNIYEKMSHFAEAVDCFNKALGLV